MTGGVVDLSVRVDQHVAAETARAGRQSYCRAVGLRQMVGRAWLAGAVACALAGLANTPSLAEVTIETQIEARQYTWTVSNRGMPPINYVEIPVYNAYNFRAPAGWSTKGSDGRRVFVARAIEPAADIRDGQSRDFVCSITREDANLGKASVTVGFRRDGGASVQVPGVMVPAPEPTSSVWSTPLVLLLFFAALILLRRRRRRASPGLAQPAPKQGERV